MKDKNKQVALKAPGMKRFAFYHQNEALLFQFLFHECLRAHQLLKKKANSTLLLQMIGSLECTADTWHAPSGHLPRLLHYCSLLATHFDDPPSLLCKLLQQTLEQAVQIAKRCHDLLAKDEQEHSKLYTKLRKEIRTLMKLLFEKVYDFRDNASVLYFLLRHQEQFDTLYREPIIKKTLYAIFPSGMQEAQNFLIEKFSKKGFNHLIPSIEQKLKNLEKNGK